MAKYFERYQNLGSAGHNLELQLELPVHGQPSTSTMSAVLGRQACLPIIHIMAHALHIISWYIFTPMCVYLLHVQ